MTQSTTLDRAAGSRPIEGNAVTLLIDGTEAYPAMLGMIAAAERWVHFENYIIRDDVIGRRFAEALIARARAGVRVRVLADWFGSMSTGRGYWRALRDAGAEVRLFRALDLLDPLVNISRDHRKLVVADGARALIGGLCVGDEWTGAPDGSTLPWRDTAILVEGPAAAALDGTFTRAWGAAGGSIPDADRAGRIAERGTASVRVVAGEPGMARTYRLLNAVAASARERLWITDAYLAPPPPLRTALIDAARDGCDVQLLVPGLSDLPFVHSLSRVGYRDLIRAGIRMHEWEGPMLHAKTFVADGHLSRIGSSNLNYASLLGNWELDVLIDDTEFSTILEQRFRKDVALSREVLIRPPFVPARVQRWVPDRLIHPDAPMAPHLHRTSRRERRRRAIVTLYSIVAGAGRSLALPFILVMVVLGATAFFLPRVVAGLTVLVALWLSQSAFRQIRVQRP